MFQKTVSKPSLIDRINSLILKKKKTNMENQTFKIG